MTQLFNHKTMRTLSETSSIAPTMMASSSLPQQASTLTVQRSPWHSPVPYLFGGLAAMLGLIAFALLILACSYWKLSGSENNGEGTTDNGDVEKGETENEEVVRMYEEKIVVIMAGDEKPTYLATPVCSRGSSFGDDSRKSNESGQEMKKEEKQLKKETMEDEVLVIMTQHQEHVSISASHEETSADQATSVATATTSSQQEDQ